MNCNCRAAETYSSILDKLSIILDMQSFALRANICLNVFRLAQAHVRWQRQEKFLTSHTCTV